MENVNKFDKWGTELYSQDILNSNETEGYIYVEECGIRKVSYCECDNLAIYEGDIILGSLEIMEQTKSIVENGLAKINSLISLNESTGAISSEESIMVNACAINGLGKRWPNSTLYYDIETNEFNSSVLKTINSAIDYLNQHTNIRLAKRNKESNYVSFRYSSGCSSYVGMIGGSQTINIANWASQGNVIHEILHAAGMWHEQSRADRNSFIKINMDNIEPKNRHNFYQHINDGIDLDVYDYGSIMHYPKKAFSKNGKATIEPIDSSASIGQRDGLSIRDNLGLQAIYRFANRTPIVDIIVIKGDSANILPPAGYEKISQDTNEGAGGKYIYVCFKRKTNEGDAEIITDITVIKGNNPDIKPPSGYTKINQDLSEGAGGKYLYICYRKNNGIPITNLSVISGNDKSIISDVGYGLSCIPQDLNEGSGGKYIYLCYQKDSRVPIEDITVISGDYDVAAPSGYERLNVDLNKGAGGKYIYLCYKRGTSSHHISDITLIAGDSSNISAPSGYEKIPQDTNQGAGGKYIYVCKKYGTDIVKNVDVVYGNFSGITAPSGWTKIPQDTNQGAGGKYIYVCYQK